ncbi:LysR family transcriptional regulator [Jeotgalibaca caeni]|uniref:LysR family transcriptional regulator n=1 Tax=Jeotgalibaca caeni TaxID=3028623 RepID=UPI00237E8E75|nr:LysR family transcriptional regulator [Jeotgalibaca caeni]MDE1547981.1 LysR family transcriptional regulator [Jeotgalibaca caeni]
MNLQDLAYFTHLAESLNFTATAEHFYVSQPSISMALKRLETELDTPLFDRRKTLKKMRLTPAGSMLYKSSKEILTILDQTQQRIQDLQQENVYYGFLPTIGGYFLPKILPKLNRFTKSLKLIEEESSDVMLKLVQQGKVPIAILGHDTPYIMDNKMKQIRLLEQEIALWVSKSHPLAGKEFVTAKEIQEEVLISLSEGYTHQRIFEKWGQSLGIKEPNIVYAKEIKTVQSIAASTQMVAFMSDILLGERTDLVRVPIQKPPKFYVSLIINTEIENNYIQQEFHDAIIDVITKDFL